MHSTYNFLISIPRAPEFHVKIKAQKYHKLYYSWPHAFFSSLNSVQHLFPSNLQALYSNTYLQMISMKIIAFLNVITYQTLLSLTQAISQ